MDHYAQLVDDTISIQVDVSSIAKRIIDMATGESIIIGILIIGIIACCLAASRIVMAIEENTLETKKLADYIINHKSIIVSDTPFNVTIKGHMKKDDKNKKKESEVQNE